MVEFNRFVKGASLVFVFSMLANLAGMVARVLLAQGYTPDIFGRIMIGFTIFNLLGTLSVWGLNTALTYYLPKEDERSEQYSIIFAATILALIISVVVSGTAIFFNRSLSRIIFGNPALSKFITPFLMGIPIYVCLSMVTSVFRGYESVRLKAISKDMFYNIAQVILIAIFIYLGIDGQFIGFVYVLSGIGTVILGIVLLYTYYPPGRVQEISINYRKLLKYWKQMVLYSTPIILLTLSNWGLNYIDTFLIQILQGSADVGFYKAVYPLALALTTVLGSFGFLYLPSLSRLQSKGQIKDVRELYAVSTYIGFAVTITPFLAILFFTPEIINLFYPRSYEVAVIPLQLLAIGFFIEIVFGLNSASLNALDRTKFNAVATLLSFTLNIALNIVLIPEYGITGAAMATAAAILLWNLLTSLWLYHTEGLHPFTAFYGKGAVATLVLTATVYYTIEYLFTIRSYHLLQQSAIFAIAGIVTLICNFVVLLNTLPRDVVDDISILCRFNRIRFVD